MSIMWLTNWAINGVPITHLIPPLAVAVGLTAAGAASAQTLTMGVRGGPESMDPHFSALGPHAEAAKHIFDTLVWSGTDLQIEPGLATSWEPVDEDTWEFKLREGVKFHDGSDFDAEDVKFSIERIPVVTGPTTTTIYVRRVASVDIIDSHTIHINTNICINIITFNDNFTVFFGFSNFVL